VSREFLYPSTSFTSADTATGSVAGVQVPSESDLSATLAAKPLYNRTNKFFTARSIADLVASLPDDAERTKWTAEAERVKALLQPAVRHVS